MNIQFIKPVVLLRHADAVDEMGEKGEISDTGFEHSLKIGAQINSLIQSRNLLILSSPAIPALQTANILRSKLKRGNIVQENRLFTDFDHYPHESWFNKRLRKFLKENHFEALLVVTHSRYFTSCFSTLGYDISLPQHGNGYLLFEGKCEPIR